MNAVEINNQIIRLKSQIIELKRGIHFNEREINDLLPIYEARLKDLQNKLK